MLKIAIGTKSSYKINAIKRAIYNLDIEFECEFIGVPSEVSEQPMKPQETKNGSINRAKNALKNLPGSDIGIGVEFGYEPRWEGGYSMVCFAAIATKEGKIFYEHSSSIQLPIKLQNAIETNVDVDSVLDESTVDLHQSHTGREFLKYLKKR
jgi:non-canonical (house-cleaning) NTP pyrophosphatase